MPQYTNREIATNFELWGEYFDPSATMTQAEFDALTIDERERMIEEAFGTDQQQREQENWPLTAFGQLLVGGEQSNEKESNDKR